MFKSPANGRDALTNQWRDEVAAALASAGLAREADSFLACQDEDTVSFVHVCSEDPDHDATLIAHTCHLRICPDCERRNSARLYERYYQPILDIVRVFRRRRGLRHIVLTTPFSLEDENIREKLRWAYAQLGRLFDLLLPEGWQKKEMGYLAGCEFGEEGRKLHFHILFYGPYIDNTDMCLVWNILTGSTVLPWIKLVDGKDHTLENAVKELVKYVTKLTTLPAHLMPVLLEAIKGTRRIRNKGIFYNLPQLEKQPTTCKVCGAPMTVWTRDHYDAHQRAKLVGDSAKLLDRLRNSPLVLKLGNKFPGNPPPDCTSAARETSFLDDGPPPRDLTTLQPPAWLAGMDKGPIVG